MPSTSVKPSFDPAPFESCHAATVFLGEPPVDGWPETFAIVTAQNPVPQAGKAPLSEVEERRRIQDLSQRLSRDGHITFRVMGASPDLSHREIGEGVSSDDLEYIACIAREFEQWGFFWVQQGEVYICRDASGFGWRVGIWSERLLGRIPSELLLAAGETQEEA
ncbi:MAG: hypothetical protein RLZZ303_492 [Candidatus Hydrogenedentota bacterium]|jgi:hypothetical protein